MFHHFGTVTNTRGDSLPGWQVECVELTDGSTVVPIYAAEDSTPILSVSGVVNRAVADADGNYDFYVADGTYSLKFYDAAGVAKGSQRYLTMYGAQTALEDSAGASRVGFVQSDTGAVARTTEAKLREFGPSPYDFGAIGDDTTDDHTALQAWLDHGGDIYLPNAPFYSSARLEVTRYVNVRGAGFTFDARQSNYQSIAGARIRFPAGVGGIIVYTFTKIADVATVLANIPAARTQEGGYGSRFHGFRLIGGGTSGTGFESRTRIYVEGVECYGFGGDGFDIQGTADVPDASSDYGSVSLSTFKACRSHENGGNGFHVRGRDASVINFDTCDAQLNGGWGYYDNSIFGASYEVCQAATNTLGAFKNVSAVAQSVYKDCYVEIGTGSLSNIGGLCTIIGGQLSDPTFNSSTNPAPTVGNGYVQSTYYKVRGNGSNPGTLTSGSIAYSTSAHGQVLYGKGSAWDLFFANASVAMAIGIPTGTVDVAFGGNVLLPSGGVVKVNGTQVLGPRQTGAAAVATDLATAITLVNDLRAKLVAHGLIA